MNKVYILLYTSTTTKTEFPYRMNTIRNPHESVYADVNRCRPLQGSNAPATGTNVKNEYVHRNWFEVRDKLRAKYPVLTEADVEFEPGQKSEMMRAIEEKLEISPSELQKAIAYL